MYRILVTGDRKWPENKSAVIVEALTKVHDEAGTNNILVIHGGAEGADRLAGKAAYTLRWGVRVHPANWSKYKRGAGPIRNTQMLTDNKVDIVLAFHDDLINSKGTRDMVIKALEEGKRVRHYKTDGTFTELEQQVFKEWET